MGKDGKDSVSTSDLAYLRDRALDEALSHLRDFKDRELGLLEASARFACLQLPSAEATENMLRYETTIRRQLERAIDQLERLQRLRKGESIPAPLSINLRRGK